MTTKISFLAATLISACFFSQTINIDTVVPSNPAPANSIIPYWYWAYGVGVTGSGFAANSAITLTATDPNNGKRTLTTTSNATGNFNFQFNAMKIKSVLGAYSLSVKDAAGATTTGNYNVVANPKEVITATATPPQFKISELTTGTRVIISGTTPNGVLKVNIGDPASNGWEVNKTTPMIADGNGNYSLVFNASTQIYNPFGQVPIIPVEGVWTLSFSDFSGNGLSGSKTFRMLPNNPSTSSYGAVSAVVTEPIVNVQFANITKLTDPDSSVSYEDFTSTVGNVRRGQEYTMNLRGNTNGAQKVSTFTVFIDWNQNGILDEDNEIYSIGSVRGTSGVSPTDQAAINQITVPADAVLGNTRMRILKVNSPSTFAMFWPSGACGVYNNGQIEDYTLNVGTALATSETATPQVKLYPNPVVDVVTVSTAQKVNSITVFDATGKMLKTNSNANSIDMSAFPKGVYIIKTDVSGKVESTKVIKK